LSKFRPTLRICLPTKSDQLCDLRINFLILDHWSWVLLNDILLAYWKVTIERYSIVPNFPHKHTKTINIHLWGWFLNFPHVLEAFWRWPHASISIVSESVWKFVNWHHFKLSYSYFHPFIRKHFQEYIMRCKMAMAYRWIELMKSCKDFSYLETNRILFFCIH
jgi:hypothetical protein